MASIARRWNFSHLGRFAVSYRQRYHESPSETLRCGVPSFRRSCVTYLFHILIKTYRAYWRTARASRGILLNAIVHELAQPLAAISLNCEASSRWLSQSPPSLNEAVTANRRVMAEVKRALGIMESLRRLLQAGDVLLKCCDVRALIERVGKHLAVALDEDEIALYIKCPPNLKMLADSVLIEQVLVNVISNSIDALRAIDPEMRQITIDASARARCVCIAIRDEGRGSDDSTLDQIFEPFVTTKMGMGRGVGLAVSKLIMDAHGGTIRATPNLPQGLVIEINVPAADLD